MSSSIAEFCQDVLGIQWIPNILPSPPFPTKVEASPSARSLLLVVVAQPFTAADALLLQRMMKAIEVEEYTVSAELSDGPGVGLILCSEVAQQLGFKEFGEVRELQGRRCWFSHCLTDLREGAAPEVQTRKRLAWTHLRQMQDWLKGGR